MYEDNFEDNHESEHNHHVKEESYHDDDIDDHDIQESFEVKEEPMKVQKQDNSVSSKPKPQQQPTQQKPSDSPKIEAEEILPQKAQVRAHSEKAHSEKDDMEQSEIGEEEGLEIAEKCFSKIADAMKAQGTTVINHFKELIESQVAEAEDGKEYEIVFIPPMSFLEGLTTLGLNLSDIEIK